jgi:hypothetical protein
MELINCAKCGKLQVRRPDTLCHDCLQIYISESNVIKDFVKANPGATIMDVVRETGYSVKRINEILNR